MSLKLIGILLLSLIAAAGTGWVAGSSGRSALELDQRRTIMRAEFAEARAQVLDGRVSLYQNNFGDAVQRFQRARDLIGRIQSSLRELGQVDQAGRLEIAISHLSDAQRAAAAFDQTKGHGAAAQAVQALTGAGG
jgi:lipopolysaccharide biosynthesis regulator YciM